MWSEAERKAWNEIDDIAAKAGGYVEFTPGKKTVHEFNYRALSRYCRERGVEPLDLPEDELNAFRLVPLSNG